MTNENAAGRIGWVDLTVGDAEGVRDFYQAVTGWRPQGFDMQTHTDYSMFGADPDMPVAGICHALGENAELPPAWLIYIMVPDLDAALATALEKGASVISGPRGEPDQGRFVILRDPAGAAFGLMQQMPGA